MLLFLSNSHWEVGAHQGVVDHLFEGAAAAPETALETFATKPSTKVAEATEDMVPYTYECQYSHRNFAVIGRK